MQEYISKQHRILRPAEQIYAVISRFDFIRIISKIRIRLQSF